MTAIQSSAAKAGRVANNPLSDGSDLPHAYVSEGDLYILDGGVYWRFDSLSAWNRWAAAVQSPMPSTQERARQIRAAMDQAFPQEPTQ